MLPFYLAVLFTEKCTYNKLFGELFSKWATLLTEKPTIAVVKEIFRPFSSKM